MYGAAVFTLAPGAEAALNRLQRFWASTILGAPAARCLPGALAAAQCGWTMRLGTRMWEYAIVALARLSLLPCGHPASAMLALALCREGFSWPSHILDYMRSLGVPALPDAPGFSAEAISQARAERATRRTLLRQYRWDIVRPALHAAEAHAYARTAARIVPVLDTPFASLMPTPARLPSSWLDAAGRADTWRCFRCWSLIRLTGRWPCSVLGASDLPFTLAHCHQCPARDITILHPLLACPGTAIARLRLGPLAPLAPPTDTLPWIRAFFADLPDPAAQLTAIEAVGQAVFPCMLAALGHPDGGAQHADACVIEPPSADAVDTLLHRCAAWAGVAASSDVIPRPS